MADTERVAFASLHTPALTIPGTYLAPRRPGEGVVVIAHGSSGPDSRGPALARALSERGIGSLEIDMWAPRGLKGGLDRPKSIPETLPDVFGAFEFLAARPDVDPGKIGISGFSWGGVLSMLTATRPYAERWRKDGRRFAAHAPFYPVCWTYNRFPASSSPRSPGRRSCCNAARSTPTIRRESPNACATRPSGWRRA